MAKKGTPAAKPRQRRPSTKKSAKKAAASRPSAKGAPGKAGRPGKAAGRTPKARPRSKARGDGASREAAEVLAARIDTLLARRRNIGRIRMFGGLCYTLGGNMACGVMGDGTLCVRVGPDAHDEALGRPHTRPMDFTGRPMRGMVYVDPRGVATDASLKAWVERGLAFARSLPPKR